MNGLSFSFITLSDCTADSESRNAVSLPLGHHRESSSDISSAYMPKPAISGSGGSGRTALCIRREVSANTCCNQSGRSGELACEPSGGLVRPTKNSLGRDWGTKRRASIDSASTEYPSWLNALTAAAISSPE